MRGVPCRSKTVALFGAAMLCACTSATTAGVPSGLSANGERAGVKSSVAASRSDTSAWPVFGHDPARSGVDAGDTILTTANVSKLAAKWQIRLGQVADSTPILVPNVKVGTARDAVLFQTAKNGETFAIQAHTGKILWRYTTSGPGITNSTPAADPSGSAVYVPGVDGKVHKLDAATGKEQAAPGFPLRVTRISDTEKNASALNVASGFLYAVTSGYFGDAPPYDGHVVAVNLSTGVTHVFNSLCSKQKSLPTRTSCPHSDSGIWSRGGAVVDPDASRNGEVYAATGNGLFNADKGGDDYGDSVLGLKADLSALDGSYTPPDYAQLENGDVDLGSTSPALIPRQSSSSTPLMLVQGGKDSILRLVDRAKLPGVGGELQQITLPTLLYATPAVWTDAKNRVWIYLSFPQEIQGYQVRTDAHGKSRVVNVWNSHAGSTNGEGTSPVVSNGIVFVAMDDGLLGLDALSGKQLWSSANTTHTIGPVHWESPIVVSGWVYCSDENGKLTAYALP